MSAMGKPVDVAAYAGWKAEILATASMAVGDNTVFLAHVAKTSEGLHVAVQDQQCVIGILRVPHIFIDKFQSIRVFL